MKPYYVTTPIYYPSGKFHIGTAYCTILVEALKKYHKQRGYDAYMLTGTDEHGLKIQTVAEKSNLKPIEYVDEMARQAQELWKILDIDYDIYMRTTYDYHEKAVQEIFERFLEQGDIYKGVYKGKYCVPCETYFTETQLVDGKCPDCNRDVVDMEEEAYFFKMSKYQDRLVKYYEDNPEFIKPESKKTEMLNNFIKPGLEDLCVTRTSFDWGIKVKSDPKHVIYVWLDALTNYITALGYLQQNDENFKKYWPANTHVVGKDIARFHLIYWPIFLMALDLPLPKHVFVHNHILMKDGKMSKSKGNVIYPEQLVERFGIDATKFILLKIMSYSQDGVFTPEECVNIYNDLLVNDLSNLVNRTIGMANKYFDGNIQNIQCYDDIDNTLDEFTTNKKEEFEKLIENFEVSHGLDKLFEIVSRTNKFIDEKEPWKLYKEVKEGNKESEKKLNSTIYHIIDNIRKISILIQPFMPNVSDNINEQLNLNNIETNYLNFNNSINRDIKVTSSPNIIFERLVADDEINYLKNLMFNN